MQFLLDRLISPWQARLAFFSVSFSNMLLASLQIMMCSALNINIKLNFLSVFYRKYSIKGQQHAQSYSYQLKKSFGTYNFIGVDACPDPGPKRPFNFFGYMTKVEKAFFFFLLGTCISWNSLSWITVVISNNFQIFSHFWFVIIWYVSVIISFYIVLLQTVWTSGN